MKERRQKISHDELLRVLNYEPETGNFYWKVPRLKNKIPAGSLAGTTRKCGRKQIGIDKITYQSSILAWFYMTGKWSDMLIDHIDRDESNNRFSNLREATNQENLYNNRHKVGKSGCKGVYWDKKLQKWRARIRFENKHVHLGYYFNKDDAITASTSFRKENHGEFYCGE